MAERRGIARKLVIGVIVVLVIVAALVVVAPLIIPSDWIAAEIAGLVYQKTGRQLKVAGPINVSLLPQPVLTAEDVRLSSPEGGFTGDFLLVKKVELALNASALLHGAIEIDRLHLSQPAFNFEVDKNGERNWIFHPPHAAPSATPAVKGGPAPSFAANAVTLVDGTAAYLDDRSGQKRSLNGFELTLSLPSLDGPLNATGAATYNSEPVKIIASIAAPSELRDGRTSAVTLDVTAARGHLGFNGTTDDQVNAAGTVDFSTPALRDLLTWLKVRVAPGDETLGALSITGKIERAGAKLTLSDTTATLDGGTAKGGATLTRADGRYGAEFSDVAVSGGKAGGKIIADETGPTPALTANLKLTGVTLKQLSFNIAGFDTLSGSGDIAVDLTGSGRTLRDVVASLNGTARLALANGTVGSAALGPLLKSQVGPAISNNAIPRQIAYSSLTASATISNGVLRSDDLKLVGPQLSATGAGTLALVPRTIDFLWNPDITGLGSAKVAITGAWDNPDYKIQSLTITKGFALPGLKPR